MTTPAKIRSTNRRQFLVLGGATVAGAAALAACSPSSQTNTSGTLASTIVPATAAPTTVSAESRAADLAILRTATSLSQSIVKFYDKMLSSSLIADDDVRTWATFMQNQQSVSVTTLQSLTTDTGGKAYQGANTYVDTTIIAPALKVAQAQSDLVKLAASLEQAAAATATLAVGTIAAVPTRQRIMAVGTTAARHVAVWNLIAANGDLTAGSPNPLQPVRDALGGPAAIK